MIIKHKLFVIILIAIVITCLIIAISYFKFKREFYSKTPDSLVMSFEEFCEKGHNKPAEKMTAGVNIPGLEGEWSTGLSIPHLTNINTYMNIKLTGFDHVRLPVNFNFYYNAEENKLIDEKMEIIDEILELAEKTGLYVQLDFHGWWEIDASKKADVDTFLNIWELVAERYKDYPDFLSFDLINEPPIKTVSTGHLNRLQKEAVQRIRKTNPTRLILCAAPDGNQPWLLNDLSLPEDDNIAVAVHIYHPGDFTHQGYVWAGREKGVKVKLDEAGLAELEWNLNETKKFIENKGYKVYLNEFGMNLEITDDEDIKTYLGTITEFCRENDIPWTLWRYNGAEMALFHQGKWKEDVLDALFLR